MADFLAPKLNKIIRGLIAAGRLISTALIISKVNEKLISRKLYKFSDSIKCLSITHFSFSKGLELLIPFYC